MGRGPDNAARRRPGWVRATPPFPRARPRVRALGISTADGGHLRKSWRPPTLPNGTHGPFAHADRPPAAMCDRPGPSVVGGERMTPDTERTPAAGASRP